MYSAIFLYKCIVFFLSVLFLYAWRWAQEGRMEGVQACMLQERRNKGRKGEEDKRQALAFSAEMR